VEVSRIILVRHGHVRGIAPEIFRGRSDLALTEKGREDAVALGRRISRAHDIAAIYCSPLSRCVETARAVAHDLNGMVLRPDGDLNDIDYGKWQGRSFAEIAAVHPREFDAWRNKPDTVEFPAGESLHKLQSRVVNRVKELVSLHGSETFVVVGHDSVNRVLLLHVLGLPLSRYWRIGQSPCCINVIDQKPDGYFIGCVNDTGHLVRA
jgi:probable phosphoglycerate mutase